MVSLSWNLFWSTCHCPSYILYYTVLSQLPQPNFNRSKPKMLICHKRPWCRLRLRASSSSALATFEPDFRGQQLRLRCSRCRRWAAPWPRWKSAEEAWEGRPVPLPPAQGWIGEARGLFPDLKISALIPTPEFSGFHISDQKISPFIHSTTSKYSILHKTFLNQYL